MNDGGVHYEDPFADPPEDRSPARRMRGRLALPVTVWTSGTVSAPFGLTVSSLMLAEGEPPVLMGLIAGTTDLYGSIEETNAFVVHVLREEDGRLAEIFAGLRPNPGGPFASVDIDESSWGPVLRSHTTRAFCRVEETRPAGYQQLVTARAEKIEVGELSDPAVYFRGRLRGLSPDARRPLL
jgi:flavin reductase (DIM6/NTAB) family NADH-FMN oxidoreductase RutF